VIVYVDSSVLLRVVTRAPGLLRRWREITLPISSELIRLECYRTIDRARIRFALPDEEVLERRLAVKERLDAFELVPLDASVLERAAEPFPGAVGSLDAIHLASALLARRRYPEVALATHDVELAAAARALGLPVLGVPARH
jgi:predicted nucleic acid-binding protein